MAVPVYDPSRTGYRRDGDQAQPEPQAEPKPKPKKRSGRKSR